MTAKNLVIYTLVVVAVLVGLFVLFLIRYVLILIFIAILLAIAIDPLADRMRARFSRGQAILVIYLLFAVAIGVLGYFLVRVIIEQVGLLVANLPALIASLRDYAGRIELPILRQFIDDLLKEASAAVGPGQGNVPGVPGGVAQGVFSVTVSIVTLAVGFFSVLVIAYYWIEERQSIIRLFVSFFPLERQPAVRAVWEAVENRLGGWVRGQLILMGIIGVLYAIGFTTIGLKYALLLAVVAGLAEMIPFLGPYIGMAPAVLVALSQDFWIAVIVLVYGIVVQLLEGNILVPRVLGSSTGISPLLVIIAVLVGAILMGIAGALLAVPVASALQVIVQALWLGPESVSGRAAATARGTAGEQHSGGPG